MLRKYFWRCPKRVSLRSWMESVEYWFWWLSRITHSELLKFLVFAIRSSSLHLTSVVRISVSGGFSTCSGYTRWLNYVKQLSKMTLKYEPTDVNIVTGSSRAVLNLETIFWYSVIKLPQPILSHFRCRADSFKTILISGEWNCSHDSIGPLITPYPSRSKSLFLFLLHAIQC